MTNIFVEERVKLGLPWGFRRTSLTPAVLRQLADQLEAMLADGYYVTDNVDTWDSQGGMNYPETLTKNRAGGSMVLEIHLGRLRHTPGTEEDEEEG